ncbi:ATP-dependent endonuclease [Halococcus sp. IIIV-5B]|uniref:ATP-dependent nuclease n=1 Tax=Halococcus sp. IIIV-5B TaxID=2321230 RepID=UPI000E74CC82|nr:AAA family ATPase [Halococcus sp. IIIV-5B]RJT05394.1 hypothetical protein D3261_06855 [Halococcus sp. IIIV-5B]
MKINKFTTKNEDEVSLSDFVILVGPNNTGKSQTLRDISDMMSEGIENSDPTIISDLDYQGETYSQFAEEFSINENADMSGRYNISGIAPNLNNRSSENVLTSQVEELREAQGDITGINIVRQRLMKFQVAFLGASSRLDIASSCETYDFHEGSPSNILQKLYENPAARQELRDAFNSIFQQDIILDFSSTRNFVLRVDEDMGDIDGNILRPTGDPQQDQAIGSKVDNQGAGYRSLAGVVLSLLLAQRRVVLLDEPEAFLHPAQAREFGIWLSEHARRTHGQIIISTHNSHFLDGVLSVDTDATVYRLNRSDDYTQYNEISRQVISNLSSDSLLSSLRVMNGVFQKGIVICEGGSDKLIYRYIADEILGERNAVYVPCNGKHNAPKIANVLREGAIPQVIVADFDILSTPSIFRDCLEGLSGEDMNDMMGKCNQINQQIRASSVDWSNVKENGFASVPNEIARPLGELLQTSENYGLYVVPVGTAEGWFETSGKVSENIDEALSQIDDDCPPQLQRFVRHFQHSLIDQYENVVVAEEA